MATAADTKTFTFTTLGALPASFDGELEILGLFGSGWNRVYVEQLMHNMGTKGLTEVHADAFEDGFEYLQASIQVRYTEDRL